MQPTIICVDAGATKTVATAYTPTGEALDSARSGFGNVTVHYDTAMGHIFECIDALKTCHGAQHIVLGGAGIFTGSYAAQVEAALAARYFTGAHGSVTVVDDARLSLYAALHGADGILIIAGTGSIGYQKADGQFYRFGGWGHILSDQGGGYSIAVEACRRIMWAYDLGMVDTALARGIFEAIGAADVRDLLAFVYGSDKGRIAGLAQVVEAIAEVGDSEAQAILAWAAQELAALALALHRRHPVALPQVAISGSVLVRSGRVKEAFQRALAAEIGAYTLHDEAFEPTAGGYYIWREGLG